MQIIVEPKCQKETLAGPHVLDERQPKNLMRKIEVAVKNGICNDFRLRTIPRDEIVMLNSEQKEM